jgi:hypothetical protein
VLFCVQATHYNHTHASKAVGATTYYKQQQPKLIIYSTCIIMNNKRDKPKKTHPAPQSSNIGGEGEMRADLKARNSSLLDHQPRAWRTQDTVDTYKLSSRNESADGQRIGERGGVR